jgi:uncharacterized protein (DUF342 family)
LENSGLKLSYVSARKRVKMELSGAAVSASKGGPEGFIERARAKMEAEKAAGNISYYLLFEQTFLRIWKELKREEWKDQSITIELAAGGHNIPGIEIKPDPQPNSAFLLTIKPSNEVQILEYDDLKIWLQHLCIAQNLPLDAHAGQIMGALCRAKKGEVVDSVSIANTRSIVFDDKPYKLVANKARKEAILIVCSPAIFSDREQLKQLLQVSQDAANKLSAATGIQYEFRKQELVKELQRGQVGPERLGIDLPLVALVAIGGAAIEEKKPAAAPQARYQGMGLLKIQIALDKMSATIAEVGALEPDFHPTRDWIVNEARRQKVVSGIQTVLTDKILESIAAKENIVGLHVAIGEKGAAPQKPFLYESYKQLKAAKPGDIVDFREFNAKSFVNPGDLVAEIRYQQPKVKGKNVLGEEFEPEGNVEFEVSVGEGCEAREPGKFYATVAGIPVIEGQSITISPTYVHKGDINLKSGNIRFEGSVVIEGTIDSGATVEVTGDLEVTGSISAANVRVGGNLNVQGGVVTTEVGRVFVRRDMRAGFVENSVISCGGNLIVRKSLLNSQVIAGENIEVSNKDGVLAGGEFSCGQDMKVGKLGFPQGAVTTCNVGVDWRLELAARIRAGRLAKLQRVASDDRMNLRELVRKKKNQMTAKHQEMMGELQNRIARMKNILAVLEQRTQQAKDQRIWNKDARILVQGLLVSNVELTVGEVKVPVKGDVAGVVVSSTRRKGSFISALEEGDETQEAS